MGCFMARFRDYAPYNNMLVRLQNQTCSFYATERDWQGRFGRTLKRRRSSDADSRLFYDLAIFNLMWFAAALRTTLADAGQDGGGAAATASSAALGALFLLLIAVVAGLGLSSFPRAMLIMASEFGLWRAPG
jgi:hypothetical protein